MLVSVFLEYSVTLDITLSLRCSFILVFMTLSSSVFLPPFPVFFAAFSFSKYLIPEFLMLYPRLFSLSVRHSQGKLHISRWLSSLCLTSLLSFAPLCPAASHSFYFIYYFLIQIYLRSVICQVVYWCWESFKSALLEYGLNRIYD